jgi:glutamine amidotransferase
VPQTVAIIDYSSGNLHSVYKKLSQIKARPIICRTADDLKTADKIILPGVGHFGTAMNCLQSSCLLDALQYEVMINRKPTFGICLGMQLMAHQSEEAPGYRGLGWVDADVVRFKHQNSYQFRTPHTGWNNLEIKKEDSCIEHLGVDDEFYFTHSYHLVSSDISIIVAETFYDYSFISVIRCQNLFGVQFHPEKSHAAGEKLFENFLSL